MLAASRLQKLPDVPTSVELGYDVTTGRYRALGVRKGTPMDRVNFLRDAFLAGMDDPAFQALKDKWLLVDHNPGGPEELQAEWDRDHALFAVLMKELGFV